MAERSGIEVYPVGFLRDWKKLTRSKKHKMKHPWKTFFRWFKQRWYRRSYWNGYLAEWHYPPYGMKHYKTGRGWTKRAAKRRLGNHIVKMNLLEEE